MEILYFFLVNLIIKSNTYIKICIALFDKEFHSIFSSKSFLPFSPSVIIIVLSITSRLGGFSYIILVPSISVLTKTALAIQCTPFPIAPVSVGIIVSG